MLLYPGLVSITFRPLSPADIIALVAKAGLRSIEWGGDVHAPAGDLARAREIRTMMSDHQLLTAAYGSYYRAGEGADFEPVLESAVALGAPVIRVWSGCVASADATEADRERIAQDLHRIAAMAASEGLLVATEYHRGTLTDTAASLSDLFGAVNHPNLYTYWQPSVDRPDAECEQELATIGRWLTHLHVYHWRPGTERRLLVEGAQRWNAFFDAAAQASPAPVIERHALIEFVKDDCPEAFLQDAATLREWCAR